MKKDPAPGFGWLGLLSFAFEGGCYLIAAIISDLCGLCNFLDNLDQFQKLIRKTLDK